MCQLRIEFATYDIFVAVKIFICISQTEIIILCLNNLVHFNILLNVFFFVMYQMSRRQNYYNSNLSSNIIHLCE